MRRPTNSLVDHNQSLSELEQLYTSILPVPFLPVSTPCSPTADTTKMPNLSNPTPPVSVPGSRANSTHNYTYAQQSRSSYVDAAYQTTKSPWHPYPSPALGPRSYNERPHFGSLAERSPSPHSRRPIPSHTSAPINDTVGVSKSTTGLIRRLSRGAHNRLRRRASTTHSMRVREESAGPVLMRRRSDSINNSDYAPDVSDFDLDVATNDDAVDDFGVAYTESRPVAESTLALSEPSPPFEGGQAHADPTILLAGTNLIKCTKKRRKMLKFWIDQTSARVCWHPSNRLKSFYIDDCELRTGVESKNSREGVQITQEEEGLLLTIVYIPMERRSMKKTMHLLMPRQSIMTAWRDCLKQVNRERISCMNALSPFKEKSERGMSALWQKVMQAKGANNTGSLSLDDIRRVCRTLEINCTDDTVVAHFKKVDLEGSNALNYARYQDFINTFKKRRDIEHLFRNVTHGTCLDMDVNDFLMFLREDQAVDVEKDKDYWISVFDRFAGLPENRAALPDAELNAGQKYMNLQAFQNFLTSNYNNPLGSGRTTAVLDRPLNEYFISSSHNTYLLGRQFVGNSSVEGYISALIKGCRCVEIDCWDGENGRPIVTHGRTITTKVSFEDCVSTIAKYAFHSSPYPLIVSLEVHCCPEQQAAMVDIMFKYWRDTMITEPITTTLDVLPSPEELRYRILVKVKAAERVDSVPTPTEAMGSRSRARSLGSAFANSPATEKPSYTSSPLLLSPASTTTTTPFELDTFRLGEAANPEPVLPVNSSADESDHTPPTPDTRTRGKTSKIIPKLGKLGVYTQGLKFAGFNEAPAKTYNHIYSFAENTFEKLCRKTADTKALLEKHNIYHLMRVYPSAIRVDSSNFNPVQAWRRGVQMAALNWQTFDVAQQINEAMFAAGVDHLGYVLKPEELRHAKHVPITEAVNYDRADCRDKKGKKLVKFTVDVISAQRLPRPWSQAVEAGMNPYIEFEMYSAEDKAQGLATSEGGTDASARDGYSGIDTPVRKRTKFVLGNGFDPSFYEPMTMTVQTKYPSLIFVRWTVWSKVDTRKQQKNIVLATFTAKLSSLQQGYRHLPLFNPHGEQYQDAKLFVKIRKEPPVPIEQNGQPYCTPEPAPFQRSESTRTDRSWPRRIFGRNPSERRRNEASASLIRAQVSRTSSVERDTKS